MLDDLKYEVYKANQELVDCGLVILTWGNVSSIDRDKGLVVIKPSGVSYQTMTKDDMVVIDLDGKKVEGKLNPSSDTPTHLELYSHFTTIDAVAHTHSRWAVAWAQAGKAIPAFGTTHADYFFGSIPCTRKMTKKEISSDYEKNTGSLIVETFVEKNPDDIPGVIVHSHGPFTWGKSPADAVHNSIVLETVAEMAFSTLMINPKIKAIEKPLLKKHFLRKHGLNAYYGQKKR